MAHNGEAAHHDSPSAHTSGAKKGSGLGKTLSIEGVAMGMFELADKTALGAIREVPSVFEDIFTGGGHGGGGKEHH